METILFFILGTAFGVFVMWLAGFRAKDVFKNLAAQVLDEGSSKATEHLASHLEPFRRDLEHLQTSLKDSSKEHFSLREQIERIGSQANDLANALTSQPKMRGNWGEIVLERMLEESGLIKDKDYKLQATLKDEDGNRLIPDVMLFLPENKHIIIDSKLTLISYKNYHEADDEETKQLHWKEFITQTKKHIEALAQKNYAHAKDVQAPSFTIMFVPIEGAFISLMQENAELHKYAWDKKIILAAPSILFALLQTVASLWRQDKQNKNADEIARLGGALYDKIAAFDDDMKKLGEQIERSYKTFEESHKKLSSGKGNILSHTQRLQKLGAKTSKQLTHTEEE